MDNFNALMDLVKRIQDALGTAETGEALVEVERNAHRAEMELASMHNLNDNPFDEPSDIFK